MAYPLKAMRGWFTSKKTTGQRVVQESPVTEPQPYPDMFIYVCGHILETIYDNCYLRDLYKSLVVHDLVPLPEKRVHLNHHCPNCLSDAFDQAWSKEGSDSLAIKWSRMISHPLDQPTGDRSKDRISSLLMFHDLWTTLNMPELQELFFDPKAEAASHIFLAFRTWCQTIALHWPADDHERRARRRLMAVLQERFGSFAANDVQKLIDLYQGYPKDLDTILTGTVSAKDGAYTACVQTFRARTRAPNLTYPLDLMSEYNDVLLAASVWSAELLGPPQYVPPQYSDLQEGLLHVSLEEETSYDRDQYRRLERAITDVNNETMRFKVQLYELFQYSELAKRIGTEGQLHLLVSRVDELEERAMLLRPLEARLRQLWGLYVAFAKPRFQRLREQIKE